MRSKTKCLSMVVSPCLQLTAEGFMLCKYRFLTDNITAHQLNNRCTYSTRIMTTQVSTRKTPSLSTPVTKLRHVMYSLRPISLFTNTDVSIIKICLDPSILTKSIMDWREYLKTEKYCRAWSFCMRMFLEI
jgi:hypothetical protein